MRRKPRRTWEACEAGLRRGAGGGGGGGGGGTVLDADPALQAVLDAAGRGGVSRDIRAADAAADRDAEAERRRAGGAAEAGAGADADEEEEFEED